MGREGEGDRVKGTGNRGGREQGRGRREGVRERQWEGGDKGERV